MIEMSNIKNDRLAQETGLLFKVIMIGGGKVGKSGIMSKMVYNKFTLGSNPTIGIEFGTMTLVHDNRFFKMQVWDTETSSGNEVQTGYYTNAIGVFLVVDLTRRETIEEAKKSLNEMREKLGTRAAVVVLGTKQDLANLREISKQDLAEFAKTQRAEFREVSAYSGLNVREAGRLMLSQITDMIVELNGFIPFEHAPRRQKALKDNNR